MKLNRTLKNSSIFCFKSLTLAARRVGNDDAERQGERLWLSLVLDTRGSTSNYNPARCSTDSPKVARLLQKKKKIIKQHCLYLLQFGVPSSVSLVAKAWRLVHWWCLIYPAIQSPQKRHQLFYCLKCTERRIRKKETTTLSLSGEQERTRENCPPCTVRQRCDQWFGLYLWNRIITCELLPLHPLVQSQNESNVVCIRLHTEITLGSTPAFFATNHLWFFLWSLFCLMFISTVLQ